MSRRDMLFWIGIWTLTLSMLTPGVLGWFMSGLSAGTILLCMMQAQK